MESRQEHRENERTQTLHPNCEASATLVRLCVFMRHHCWKKKQLKLYFWCSAIKNAMTHKDFPHYFPFSRPLFLSILPRLSFASHVTSACFCSPNEHIIPWSKVLYKLLHFNRTARDALFNVRFVIRRCCYSVARCNRLSLHFRLCSVYVCVCVSVRVSWLSFYSTIHCLHSG